MPEQMANLPAIELNALSVFSAVGTLVIAGLIYRFYRILTDNKKKYPVLLADPATKYKVPLLRKDIVSHDTRKFRFALPTEEHVLGLPVGQHINLIAQISGDTVIRSYTPVSSDEDHGYVDLVIKVYFSNMHPKFPEGGKLSQYLNNMKIGDSIDIRGPSGRLIYEGNGRFKIRTLRRNPPETYFANKVVMLAGGTGITPMLQLIRAIIRDRTDETQVSLLYANQTQKDILLRSELDQLSIKYPDKIKVWYTLDAANDGWRYSTGYINADMIKQHMFPPSHDTMVLMCGPPPMINFACLPNLDKLGYDQKLRYVY